MAAPPKEVRDYLAYVPADRRDDLVNVPSFKKREDLNLEVALDLLRRAAAKTYAT